MIEPASLPTIALVPGDPTGIGPELTARIIASEDMGQVARFVVVGDSRIMDLGCSQAGLSPNLEIVSDGQAAQDVLRRSDRIPLVDLRNLDPSTFALGEANPEVGAVVGATLEAAIGLAKGGFVDAITFAPLNKQAMFQGGWKFPDEHKLFAHLMEFNGLFSEMNVLDGRWMTRVTSHVSLREAIDQITPDRIRDALILADRTMRNAGIDNPRIAVAALNPHGGEGGLFGREEIDVIKPTVEEMALKGINCHGPFPSDTVYLKAFDGQFDSVLAMYHDQGQIATKLKGFNRGVTVTAGLPIVFTTPAHGTAYDIVGKGIADPGATASAVRLAAQLSRRSRTQSGSRPVQEALTATR
ncbi:PdxA family dehydrogenase [Hoeflea ulvae]|uniref:4-hydroxythreonine-4-phosphate dehydrogenase PdxA n=1 Tax=Hoeflea ulvae TaxID=2983764 RepID=A0ABT3YMA0_9HYPH|nr:4-hydroxythreonine-4-phosphate dehydrogenase PdxA [Hoeflea ulvae]MCY0096997.1 4-hydroxythreonine-4-phosphate dehydrogenase PdxA [Hoeflea ulvae]